MAELDLDTTDDVVDDVETSYEDYTEDYTEDSTDTELTVDDYKKERSARIKAENNWIKPTKALMKELWVKSLSELKSKLANNTSTPNAITEEELALREEMSEFLSENKDLKEYKQDLMKYAKKMLADWDSMKTAIRKAKALVENDDKTIENRRKLQSLDISTWEDSQTQKTTYTKADLADPNLSQEKYNKIMAKVRSGEIKLK